MTASTDLLRRPVLRWFFATRFFTTFAMQMVSVAVGWQVYAQTGRAADLGYVGLVQFIPQLLLFPLAGAVVDRMDRRRVLGGVALGYLLAALALAALSAGGGTAVAPVFGVLVMVAVARTFSGPAAQSTLPRLVTAEELPAAASWSSTAFTLAVVLGPALGGLIYAAGGPVATYLVAAALLVGAFLATLALPPVIAPGTGRKTGLDELTAGLRFIRSQPILLAALSLDLFAVLLGGAVALLPIYARDILHAGPGALGVLRAAPAVGATLTAIGLASRPIQRRVGVTLLVAVAGFGLATIGFALSTEIWTSALALALVGAADEVSVFIRMNIVQLATPDEVRGRVSAAQFVFIGASNELGEAESGLLAAAVGPVEAAVIGGVGAIAVTAAVAALAPGLRRLDRFEDLGKAAPVA